MPTDLNISNLLCKDIDGYEVIIPPWAKCLMELGIHMSRLATELPKTGRPVTIALCLPRIEYAAVFLGCGVILDAATSGEQNNSDLLSQMEELKGCDVSVIYRTRWRSKYGEGVETKTEIGSLKEIENDPKRGSQVVFQTGTKTNSKLIIPLENVLSLMPMEHSINLARKRSSKHFQKAQESHNLKASLFSSFGRSVSTWLVTNQRPVVSIIGGKQRILSECELSIAADRKYHVKIRDIVRFKDPDSQIAHSVLESLRDPSGPCDIAVVEAGRGLVDTLHKIRAQIRFVLLDRSSLTYEENADSVLALFNTRKPDSVIKLPSVVSSIQTMVFTS